MILSNLRSIFFFVATLVITAYTHVAQPLVTRESACFVETAYSLDPLEQFEVLVVGPLQLTNIAAVLVLILAVYAFLLANFNPNLANNYDYVMNALYQLTRSIVKENIYMKKQQYFANLFYLFLIILLCNMVGLIPYSFTVTSSFVVTFFLALGAFIAINLISVTLHRWELAGSFLPTGSPLAISPFLVFIEAVSYFARVFSLSIRLFANMMSGHALLKILSGFSWSMLQSRSLLVAVAVFPWLIVTTITFLELLISFLQAYVFSILVSIYLNDAINVH
jgi:ATP synthase subunit 6